MAFETQKNRDSEKGITLLLTVLIVSGLVIISITVAALGISELRSSRAFRFSEPAIGAAQSGAENAIWALKRTSLVNCSSQTQSTNLTTGVAKNTYCKNTTIPAIFSVQPNNPFVFYLFDANSTSSTNTDLDLLSMNPTYKTLTVTYLSGTVPVTARVDRLSGANVGSASLSTGSQTISNLQGTSGNDNRMQVTLTLACDQSASCEPGDSASVSVNTNAGLPSFPTLDSTGCSGLQIGSSSVNCSSTGSELFSRRLQVVIPQ